MSASTSSSPVSLPASFESFTTDPLQPSEKEAIINITTRLRTLESGRQLFSQDIQSEFLNLALDIQNLNPFRALSFIASTPETYNDIKSIRGKAFAPSIKWIALKRLFKEEIMTLGGRDAPELVDSAKDFARTLLIRDQGPTKISPP